MSKPTKPATMETQDRIELEVPSVEPDAKPPSSQSKIDEFVKRRDEVAARDHDEFQDYLRLKEEEQARKGDELVPAAADYTPAGNIVREVVDTASDIRGRSLGNWVALLPTKMGGGTYAIDLHSNRVLGSIWYWNYGDYNPISHHLCAFPSADPKHGFEFVNSTQGGQNSLIYGMPNGRHRGDRTARHQHLPRAFRRHADAARRKRLRNHWLGARGPCHGQPEGRAVLFR